MSLHRDGFCWIRKALPGPTCEVLSRRVERFLEVDARAKIASTKGAVVGGRNLLSATDIWRDLFDVPSILDFVHDCVGDSAGVVRILFFDKPPGQGWALPLHRDKTIAVADHPERLAPFRKPTVKAGTPHVEVTDDLLKQMVTLRVHLDPMGEANGPLFVVPGSHRNDEAKGTVEIHCDRGDVFAMRPLLLHGSRAADPENTMHRRTLHLEISPHQDLPGGCRWNRFEPLIPRRKPRDSV